MAAFPRPTDANRAAAEPGAARRCCASSPPITCTRSFAMPRCTPSRRRTRRAWRRWLRRTTRSSASFPRCKPRAARAAGGDHGGNHRTRRRRDGEPVRLQLTAFGRLELERQKYKATYSFQAGVVNVWFAQSNQVVDIECQVWKSASGRRFPAAMTRPKCWEPARISRQTPAGRCWRRPNGPETCGGAHSVGAGALGFRLRELPVNGRAQLMCTR